VEGERRRARDGRGGGRRGRPGEELGRERGRAAGYQIRSDVIAEQISTYLAT
jgi:hypothetical protein